MESVEQQQQQKQKQMMITFNMNDDSEMNSNFFFSHSLLNDFHSKSLKLKSLLLEFFFGDQ